MQITIDTSLGEVLQNLPKEQYLLLRSKTGERYSGKLTSVGLDFIVLQAANQKPVYIAFDAIESFY